MQEACRQCAPSKGDAVFLLQAAYDMQKAWEGRCRSYYQERYDTMRNAVRLLQTASQSSLAV